MRDGGFFSSSKAHGSIRVRGGYAIDPKAGGKREEEKRGRERELSRIEERERDSDSLKKIYIFLAGYLE